MEAPKRIGCHTRQGWTDEDEDEDEARSGGKSRDAPAPRGARGRGHVREVTCVRSRAQAGAHVTRLLREEREGDKGPGKVEVVDVRRDAVALRVEVDDTRVGARARLPDWEGAA